MNGAKLAVAVIEVKVYHRKVMSRPKSHFFILSSFFMLFAIVDAETWLIDSQKEWSVAMAENENLEFEEGVAVPTAERSIFRSKVKRFGEKRRVKSITFEQSPLWLNWEPVENIGPSNLRDAPVLLCIEPGNYWMFGIYGVESKSFKAETAELEGFDIPLKTTPFLNQFDAPGGLEKGLGGYHAWQSRDMKNWVHHGPITEGFSRWVTSAEYVDGKAYIYYDYPNDQDPHLYIDADLADGKPGENKGLVVPDPSHGSDSAVIRGLDGRFHVIFEDWSPIDASKRSWDSPLAGHAVSDDGIGGFKFLDPAVDNRTKPTGETLTYQHPHWKQHPDWDTNIGEYEVHEPEQDAYGDWAAIAIGGRYWLFGDFDPAGEHEMSVGWFTSPSLEEQFTWCGNIGKGHPDPDIGFAEGKFQLVTQQSTDFVSPGPWVEKVETRVGVDTDDDGRIDEWTDWQEVKESYKQREGFAKQIDKIAAEVDLSVLPAGKGFAFEFRTNDTTANKSKPMMDKITVAFE